MCSVPLASSKFLQLKLNVISNSATHLTNIFVQFIDPD